MNPRKSPPDERLPLYQRLRDEMLEKITLGEWHPDEAIPPESELTRTYGVAVGTIRKAVGAESDVIFSSWQRHFDPLCGRGYFLCFPVMLHCDVKRSAVYSSYTMRLE